MLISVSRKSSKDLIESGKAVKIELVASTGDRFAERFAEFLENLGKFVGGGSSRTVGIVDASSDDERAIKTFIDGDGADFIRDVKIVKE